MSTVSPRGFRTSIGTPASIISPSGPVRPCRARSKVPSMTSRLTGESPGFVILLLWPECAAGATDTRLMYGGSGGAFVGGGLWLGHARLNHSRFAHPHTEAVGERVDV